MVCHANRTLRGKQKIKFLKIFGKPVKTMGDLKQVRRIFVEGGSLDHAFAAIETRLKQAQNILENLKMHAEYRDLIRESLMKLFSHSQRIQNLNQSRRNII